MKLPLASCMGSPRQDRKRSIEEVIQAGWGARTYALDRLCVGAKDDVVLNVEQLSTSLEGVASLR